ncbi:hypothetical protein O1611_g4213 [Lasiodiplodia mahajangana]|uniref:Uncharacterized protein n=1 Tax=Lasiodiplodia mahajangana TaxID=1108764 RepID=A0ACC2JQ81_9PEZI|nr:hypothetical protein O1611_g4213 [Lasiodiplodia mahajangana]
MRASIPALFSLAAVAAANPSYGPPDENVTITVGAGSSLDGYQLVGFVENGAGFPEFVTAADAAEASSVFYLFYKNYGHFGWYTINIDIGNATYATAIKDEAFQGPIVFIDPETYGTSIWSAETATSALTWTGDPSDFPYACTNDGHIQLAIYTPGTQPANCEQITLEFQKA